MGAFEQGGSSPSAEELAAMKAEVVENIKSGFEDFQANKPQILEAVKKNDELPDDATEEEFIAAANELTGIQGHDSERQMLGLLREGYTPEELGTSRDELIEVFSTGDEDLDQGLVVAIDEILAK